MNQYTLRKASSIPRQSRSGLTYIEVVLSTVLVGTLAVTALSASAFHARNANRLTNQGLTIALADRLLVEVSSLRFSESATGTTLGVESGEQTANRASWDDVDDAHGYSASPPKSMAGLARNELTGWSESVQVVYNSPTDLVTSNSATGLKRITVMVSSSTGESVTRRTLVSQETAIDPMARSSFPVRAIDLNASNFMDMPGATTLLLNQPIP